MFTVTMQFQKGPTIMESDTEEVTVVRVTHDLRQLAKIHDAAHVLGCSSYHVDQDKS